MRTRRDLLALGSAALLAPLEVLGQERGRVFRVGFLGARHRSTRERPDVFYDAWLHAMRDLGYIEGKNLVVEWRFAEDHFERLPALAAELVAVGPAVIVTHALPSTRALQKATSTIPIVFASMNDPVGNRVAQSLARPGGNITGLSLMTGEISVKRVEILKQLVPTLVAFDVLGNPGSPAHPAMLKNIQEAAKSLGLTTVPIEAHGPEEIERYLISAFRKRTTALIVLEDGSLTGQLGLIARLCLANRVAVLMPFPEGADAGGLVSYGINLIGLYRRAATYVDKILMGANPADLPIEQPTKLDLVINRKTATALGIVIPPEILILADRVID